MTSFTKYGGMIAFGLLIMLAFQNCGDAAHINTFSSATAAGDVDKVESILLKGKSSEHNPHRCVKTTDKCFTETFQQPVTNTKAVDVLFVVQTSEALSSERQAIVAGIDKFITSLPAGSNFNIAVMLAHGSTSGQSGRLYRAANEPIVLKSSELSSAQIQVYLNAKLNQVPADPNAGGGEEGLYSLFNGVTTPTLLNESQSLGFFRAEAALGVIFVADHRDICAAVPNGVPAETDPDKIAARNRDCEGLSAAGLSARLKALKGTQPVAISGIIYVDTPAPAGNEVGYGYTDMIALNPGVAIDMANDDISEGLASIGELSGQQMTIQKEFILDYTGVDPKRITVTVNGAAAAYTLDGNKVILKNPPPVGAVVVISYCLQAKPNTPGCHHRMHKGLSHYGGDDDRKHKNCR